MTQHQRHQLHRHQERLDQEPLAQDLQAHLIRPASHLPIQRTDRLDVENFEIFELNQTAKLRFFPTFLTDDLQAHILQNLTTNLTWQQEFITLFGKTHPQPRLTAWLGRGFSAASKYTKPMDACPWTDETAFIRDFLARHFKVRFNSCLVNYYRNGDDCMGMHSDDEACLGKHPMIASISLGCGRDIVFHHKSQSQKKFKLFLPGGSLLVMEGSCQEDFKHGVPRRAKLMSPRINLTFRHLISV